MGCCIYTHNTNMLLFKFSLVFILFVLFLDAIATLALTPSVQQSTPSTVTTGFHFIGVYGTTSSADHQGIISASSFQTCTLPCPLYFLLRELDKDQSWWVGTALAESFCDWGF